MKENIIVLWKSESLEDGESWLTVTYKEPDFLTKILMIIHPLMPLILP